MTFKNFRLDSLKLFETQHNPYNGLNISKQYSNDSLHLCMFLTEKSQKYVQIHLFHSNYFLYKFTHAVVTLCFSTLEKYCLHLK